MLTATSRPAGRPPSVRRRRPRQRATTVRMLAIGLTMLLVASCGGSSEPTRRLDPSDTVRIETALTYWTDGKQTLRLDACLPPGTTKRPGMLVVHGGAFVDGDRDNSGMRSLCTQVARLGVAAFSVDYRLAPRYRYPDQITDLLNALAWLRKPAQAKRFALDPAHIGVIGSSAGAILAQSLGTRGKGPLSASGRVSAVVSLSGVSSMTPEALELGAPTDEAEELILNYLGCESVEEKCPQAEPASAITAVDKSDPPMLLVNGSDELVPREQADAMTAAMKKAGAPVQTVIVEGNGHGLGLLNNDVRKAMKAFLDKYL